MSNFVQDTISTRIDTAVAAIDTLKAPTSLQFIEEVADLVAMTFLQGGKILIAGNGGSLCDATHFAEELTGFFSKKRRQALPVIVLSEPGHITCTANDIGYEFVFSRGVEAFGKSHDIFMGLSTSGNSKSVLNAFHKAKELNLSTVSLLGKTGGLMQGLAEYELLVNAETTDRVQEVHMTALHIIIELVENKLFSTSNTLQVADTCLSTSI